MPRYGTAQDFMQIPARQFVAEKSATPPSNPVAGQQWTDTSVTPNKVRWYDGTNWVAADGTSIPTGYISDALVNPNAGIQLSKLAIDPLARTNHTGVQPASTISDFDAAVRNSRLDQLASPTSNLDINGVRLVNVANPAAPGDAATKSYVDNARAGISVKDPVRVVAQGNVNLASPGPSIDGVALNDGDRFLAPAQNSGNEIGIYVWNGATNPATRASDTANAGDVVDGSMVAVAEGTDANHQYIQTAGASGAPGSWTQSWVIFTMGGQTYTAGNGLTISGTQFSIDGPVSIANGGTGAATASAARANLGAVTKFAADCAAMSAGVVYTVAHGLNSTDVGVWLKTTADNRVIEIDWATTDANTVSLYPDMSFSAGQVRVLVIG